VKDEDFIDDGIHFTSPGYVIRSRAIANSVAHAFPPAWQVSLGRPEGCVVS